MASWLSKGTESIKERDKAERPPGRRWTDPDRFWMPYESVSDLAFIDDEGAGVYEHGPYINGSRKGNWFTCPEIGSPCCQKIGSGPRQRYMIVFYTVVDCTAWEDSKGETHQFYLKLFGAKYGTFDKLSVKRKEEGGLAGKLWRARRYKSKTEPSVGSEHTLRRDIDLEALFVETKYKGSLLSELYNEAERDPAKMAELAKVFDLQYEDDGSLKRVVPAFNYEQVLAPPDDAQMELILKRLGNSDGSYRSSRTGGGGGGSFTQKVTDVSEDDIPF